MKKIHMIGNTHIDPVWLWTRAEGAQEIKSSFMSALERMEEFPDFIFTMSSGSFLEWIRDTVPQVFERIRERVAEGRWELAGGMWVEPDCNLPSGESLIRHFLYTAELYEKEFGTRARICYNVDAFGHSANLPAILAGCGMTADILCRPARKLLELPPVFRWRAPGGAEVLCERSGGEYLAWTKPSIELNLSESLEMMEQYGQDSMAVFYGVGNHGGGPTVDNIKSIYELREERADLQLDFSRVDTFFQSLDAQSLPVIEGELGPIFTGCYSSDNEIKRLHKRSEWALIKAESILAIAECLDGQMTEARMREKLDDTWKELLFHEFHDVLSGTCIRPARDEACRALGGVLSSAERLIDSGVQRIAQSIDTRGDGSPLVVVNPTGRAYRGVLQAECYCPASHRKQLRLRGTAGEEIITECSSYTSCAHDNGLSFLFEADVPPFGYAVYRMLQEGPALLPDGKKIAESGYVLDNGITRVTLDEKTGCPASISNDDVELLDASCYFGVFEDRRGAWGASKMPDSEPSRFLCESISTVENNSLRAVLRAVLSHERSRLTLDYILCKGDEAVTVQAYLHNAEKYAQICFCVPTHTNTPRVLAETAFLAEEKRTSDGSEQVQHRFAGISAADGAGIAVFSDSAYGFIMKGNEYRLILSRSVLFAHGDDNSLPENPPDSEFMDQGCWSFTYSLLPHGKPVEPVRLFERVDHFAMPPVLLADCCHDGMRKLRTGRAVDFKAQDGVSVPSISASRSKPGALRLRLLETNGRPGGALVCGEMQEFLPYEIKTLLLCGTEIVQTDLLESVTG